MDTPTYNAEGMQIYKPQPGEYWKHGLRFRESYGGIIAEIQDAIEAQGSSTKSYPQNFAGIIAALNDLRGLITEGELPNVGVYPPGWEIITDGDGNAIDGNWTEPPKDGTLWFDTRQGRLFIANEGQYWQTNGGDGLASVGPNAPTNPPVIGSTWFDTANEVLYVYVGTDADGNGLWQLVKGAGELTATTATLPLAMAKSTFSIHTPYVIPEVPIDNMGVQKDYNEYIFASLVALDKALTESTVTISDTPPTENVVNGTLWYDSSTLELSIWYEDDDSAQWVPTAVSYSYDEDLAVVRASITAETTAREYAISQLLADIEELRQGKIPDIDAIEAKIVALEDHVNNHPVEVDLSGYATTDALNANTDGLLQQIADVRAEIPSVTPFATNTVVNSLAETVATLPRTADITAAVSAAAPDLTSFVTQTDIDNSINNITTEYLPRTGGTLSGAFVIEKVDSSKPAFDFTNAKWYSYNTHKYRTNSVEDNFATFGTNENPWEYAWDFSSNEDFCWVFNDSSKVISITKDGPACSQLYLGDFQPNNQDGRHISNKIDVRDRLTTYQLAFQEMRQGVADATDFDSLRSNILSALAIV